MKKNWIIACLVGLLVLSAVGFAGAEGYDEWLCPVCSATATGNFCSNCGTKRIVEADAAETPAEWLCPFCNTLTSGNFCSNCGLPVTAEVVSGNIYLDIRVSFDKNRMFSKYDVDMYLDDTLITTLPHGQAYSVGVGVSRGVHVLSFYEDGDPTVKGVCQFMVTENSTFSCNIHANYDKVTISGEQLGFQSVSENALTKDAYMSICLQLKYNDIERNPNQYRDVKTWITGTVVQVIEGRSNKVTLLVQDDQEQTWYVTYTRGKSESRILQNDRVAVYGACGGVETYTTTSNLSVTVPSIAAKYIIRQ